MNKDGISNIVWWGLIPLTLALLAIATPYLFTHSFPFIALVSERAFALVCHQHPERSLEIFGGHVAVCARCLGIYLGAAIGAVFVLARRTTFCLLLLAAALNFADVVSEAANLHGNWMPLRLTLGMLFSFAAAACVRICLCEHMRGVTSEVSGTGSLHCSLASSLQTFTDESIGTKNSLR